MAENILIVDDEETLRESLGRLLTREGYGVTTAASAEGALEILDGRSFDLVITDIVLPGMDGIELLRRCRERSPDQLVIIITAYASLETAVEALRAGAYDYIMKPIVHQEIKTLISHAFRQRSLIAENTILKKQIEREYDFGRIVGDDGGLKAVMDEVGKVADSRSNVLIYGETGTGKELFARAIHYNSPRSDKPFVPINCSAIPDNLLESELFGHTKGAFTGADTARKGLFEEASGGTVFLDEIGDMSQALQAKLLRAIEEGEIRPVGGTSTTKVDLRFISATNRDLKQAAADGRFREDLYYRINTINLTLPPLRERRGDIPRLLGHFLARFASELGKPVRQVSEEVENILYSYDWPGNVRELKNITERAVLISDGPILLPEHLPDGVRGIGESMRDPVEQGLSIEEYTKSAILRHQSMLGEQQLADMLGITRKSLWEKRKRWNIKRR